ncbi:LysR family transcriptional regulator [Amphritea sp. 1_MG-2023]|uniref:LysR family transcriptional regulator n=1 Tax=Amphritea sp. 1_MG-2023 TaxID=3062670 RepID=UPI0026E30F3A|nr:LysR family transcriptional regulator [Amphritea sp. 1_MG-2023]MDO6563567.1 LysR family transcriptional regulator [Amphritea sp. 1_MG-2023]
MINPVFLRTFMSLVKTKHFTRTAESLNMTQPGVSQHIKKLEERLGKSLLHRHGKTFELTPAGERLYQFGLQQAEAEAELISAMVGDDQYAGECKIACSGSMAMQLYPRLLGLQQQYPRLSCSVEAAPNGVILERIRSNQSDMGIMTQLIVEQKLTQQKLGEDALCLVVPVGCDTSWEGLMQLGFIDHPDGHHYATQVLEANFSDHYHRRQKIPVSSYINQLSQILLPVSQGLGFTVLPKSSVEAFPYPQLIERASLPTSVNETVYLIYKKHRPLPARYGLIKDLLLGLWA